MLQKYRKTLTTIQFCDTFFDSVHVIFSVETSTELNEIRPTVSTEDTSTINKLKQN